MRVSYLYVLSYMDDIPFYIGKGTGNRIDTYRKSVLHVNPILKKVLNDIVSSGNNFKSKILMESENENIILNMERNLIKSLSSTGLLTNIIHNRNVHNYKQHLQHLHKIQKYEISKPKKAQHEKQSNKFFELDNILLEFTVKRVDNKSLTHKISYNDIDITYEYDDYFKLMKIIKRDERKQRKLKQLENYVSQFGTK